MTVKSRTVEPHYNESQYNKPSYNESRYNNKSPIMNPITGITNEFRGPDVPQLLNFSY